MKNRIPAIAAIFIAGIASAGIPVFVALCPGDISVDSAKTGVVYVNGAKAAVEKFNNNTYEAKSGAVTISVSANGKKAPDVSFTGLGHASGICQVTGYESPKPESTPLPATTGPSKFERAGQENLDARNKSSEVGEGILQSFFTPKKLAEITTKLWLSREIDSIPMQH